MTCDRHVQSVPSTIVSREESEIIAMELNKLPIRMINKTVIKIVILASPMSMLSIMLGMELDFLVPAKTINIYIYISQYRLTIVLE